MCLSFNDGFMRNRKDCVDYLMLELDKFKRWYTSDSKGFGGNKNMLQVFESVLTALTIINFDGLNQELQDSINKVEEITMILSKRAGKSEADYTSQAFTLCPKALSILVNKLK